MSVSVIGIWARGDSVGHAAKVRSSVGRGLLRSQRGSCGSFV